MTAFDRDEETVAPHVNALAERLRSRTYERRLPSARTIASLCAAARLLQHDRGPFGQELRRELQRTSGLSEAMVEWALSSTLGSVRPAILHELALAARTSSYCQRVAPQLVAVILAGNVFSSALRALFLPLLAGAPVLVKTASRDGAFPRALKHALGSVDASLAEWLEVVSFGREDSAATSALLSAAEVVSAYGDDASLDAIARVLPQGARFIPHGHGLSAAYICAEQLSNLSRARDTADRVALDVAAYDQRGCLSPHAIFVEAGAAIGADEFADMLAEESLPLVSELLPRGALSPSEQAATLQWRAVAAVRGRLLASHSYAVSVEPLPARPSPGGRQVGIYTCSNTTQLAEHLAPFQPHLKCLGVGAPEAHAELATALRPLGAPRMCRIGEMQTPSFDADADGQAPLAGLLSFRDLH